LVIPLKSIDLQSVAFRKIRGEASAWHFAQ
jgi:hypothetical protein